MEDKSRSIDRFKERNMVDIIKLREEAAQVFRDNLVIGRIDKSKGERSMKGGKDEERLYLYDLDAYDIKATDLPNMPELIARHKARYHLAAFLARPGMKVLDFPCGSGYGSEILENVEYHGMDNDQATIAYAKVFYLRLYCSQFSVNNLTNNPLHIDTDYDLILCIEGIEHIEQQYQAPLIKAFYDALKPGGRLLITTPIREGPTANPYHLYELSHIELINLLCAQFRGVQMLYHRDNRSWMYGICRK